MCQMGVGPLPHRKGHAEQKELGDGLEGVALEASEPSLRCKAAGGLAVARLTAATQPTARSRRRLPNRRRWIEVAFLPGSACGWTLANECSVDVLPMDVVLHELVAALVTVIIAG